MKINIYRKILPIFLINSFLLLSIHSVAARELHDDILLIRLNDVLDRVNDLNDDTANFDNHVNTQFANVAERLESLLDEMVALGLAMERVAIRYNEVVSASGDMHLASIEKRELDYIVQAIESIYPRIAERIVSESGSLASSIAEKAAASEAKEKAAKIGKVMVLISVLSTSFDIYSGLLKVQAGLVEGLTSNAKQIKFTADSLSLFNTGTLKLSKTTLRKIRNDVSNIGNASINITNDDSYNLALEGFTYFGGFLKASSNYDSFSRIKYQQAHLEQTFERVSTDMNMLHHLLALHDKISKTDYDYRSERADDVTKYALKLVALGYEVDRNGNGAYENRTFDNAVKENKWASSSSGGFNVTRFWMANHDWKGYHELPPRVGTIPIQRQYAVGYGSGELKRISAGINALGGYKQFGQQYVKSVWKMGPIKNGVYRIKNKLSTFYLSTVGSRDIQQIKYKNDDSQKWEIIALGNNIYQLKNLGNGECMEVPDWSYDKGKTIKTWPCNSLDRNKTWRIKQHNQYYSLINQYSYQALNIRDNSNKEGAKVEQWTSFNWQSQKWEIDRAY